MLAALAGRIYDAAPQQNAFPLGRTTDIRRVKRLVTLLFLVQAVSLGVSAEAQSTSPGGFLDRPYTLRDRVIDQLKQDADKWATQISGRDFSEDLVEGQFGLQANGTAFLKPGTSQITVRFGFVVDRIVGDRRKACESSLQLAYSHLMPPGRDIRGNDMRARFMMDRIGPAAAHDTAAARVASVDLVQATTVNLLITELPTRSWVSCALGADGRTDFQDSRAGN